MINNKKMSKGITLIALVVTIIVLLILAGISVQMLTGDNGILTQSQKASIKSNKTAELERVQLSVGGSYGDEGNLELTRLLSNLANEIPEASVVTQKDSNGNDIFPVTVTGKYGVYEISSTGRIEKKGGASLNQELIAFNEANTTYTSQQLTVSPLDGVTITGVSWSVPEDNGLVSLSSTTGTSVIVNKLETPTKVSTTITATIRTDDEKEYIKTCSVIYTETTVAGLTIVSENLTLTTKLKGTVMIAGRGNLGTAIPLTSSDLSKIGLTETNNIISGNNKYITIGTAVLSGDQAAIEITAGSTKTPTTPVTLTAKWNGTNQIGDNTSITVTVKGFPNYLGYYVKQGNTYAIIYADLLAENPPNNTSGKLGRTAGMPTSASANTYKTYAESSETIKPSENFPAAKELTISGNTSGTPRFLAMKLTDESGKADWATACSGHVKGTNTWFLPSRDDWLMIGAMLTKVIGNDSYSSHGLKDSYWTSTGYYANDTRAWNASLKGGCMNYGISKTGSFFVRLSTIF